MGKRIVHAVISLLLSVVIAGALAWALRFGLIELLGVDDDGWPTIAAAVLWFVLALIFWLIALGRRAGRQDR